LLDGSLLQASPRWRSSCCGCEEWIAVDMAKAELGYRLMSAGNFSERARNRTCRRWFALVRWDRAGYFCK